MAEPQKTTSTPGNKGCVACGAPNPHNARFCAQCGASLPISTSGSSSKAAAMIQEAHQHLTLQHFEEAALAAEAALVLEPNSSEAHHLAAQARLKQGMRASAARHAEAAVKLAPENAEYQTTYLATHSTTPDTTAFDWNRPGVIATASALGVILLVALTGWGIRAARNGRDNSQNDIPQTMPNGQASQYAPSMNSGQPYPQPIRPAASQAGKPRVPSRATAPGPTELDDIDRSAAPITSGGSFAGTPNYAPSNAVTLAPAPVDTSPLNRFAPPEPVSTPTPRRTTTPVDRNQETPSVVIPPAPQPGGGTLFGGTGFGPARTTPQPMNPETGALETAPDEQPVRSAPSSPQQAYVQRDYGAAISGYLSRIAAGEATGSNYQQLGLAYERVGDRQNARAAYNAAIKAYQAQMNAGTDSDVAARGLKSTQRSLNMLVNR